MEVANYLYSNEQEGLEIDEDMERMVVFKFNELIKAFCHYSDYKILFETTK